MRVHPLTLAVGCTVWNLGVMRQIGIARNRAIADEIDAETDEIVAENRARRARIERLLKLAAARRS